MRPEYLSILNQVGPIPAEHLHRSDRVSEPEFVVDDRVVAELGLTVPIQAVLERHPDTI